MLFSADQADDNEEEWGFQGVAAEAEGFSASFPTADPSVDTSARDSTDVVSPPDVKPEDKNSAPTVYDENDDWGFKSPDGWYNLIQMNLITELFIGRIVINKPYQCNF